MIADPGRCLEAVDDMLRGSGALGRATRSGAWWPRACACLIRLALEASVNRFWQTMNPDVAEQGTMRTKLLMLRRLADRDIVRRAAFAWAALSRATHHQCYETTPTLAELRHLHTEVSSIVTNLDPSRRGNRPPPDSREAAVAVSKY